MQKLCCAFSVKYIGQGSCLTMLRKESVWEKSQETLAGASITFKPEIHMGQIESHQFENLVQDS